jgi:hypothetical protein
MTWLDDVNCIDIRKNEYTGARGDQHRGRISRNLMLDELSRLK